MYKSNSYGYDHQDMSWAIARQDEALEDLIKSTRRVIRKHSDYMADTRYPEQPQYYHQRPSFSHKRPSCSHHHTNRINPIPPPPPPQQQKYHKSYQQSYNNFPDPRKYCKTPSSPLSSPREYYHKYPENSFSRTKKWLNRLKLSNYYQQPVHPKQREYMYEDHETDDEIGLFELKERIRRSSSNNNNKVSPTSLDSRPMIIPASIKSSPEKIIVVDVPLDTTVILRSVNQKEINVSRITDRNLVEEILGESKKYKTTSPIELSPTSKKVSYKTKAENNKKVPMTIQTSATMPNLPSLELNTASTIVSSKNPTPVKKKIGLTKYFTTLNVSKTNDQTFKYLDSDDSTIEEVDRANGSSIQSSTATSLSEEICEAEEIKREIEPPRNRWTTTR